MKALIVGGTGVISTAVVDEAVRQGVQITCINRGNNHGQTSNPDIETLHFDVRNREKAEKMLKGRSFDVIVDFVCFNANHARYSLDLFHDKCTQYVFISTDSVYKLQTDGRYSENCEQSNSEWDYSCQKAECEKIVIEYCKKVGLTYTIVRPSITYGNTRIPYGFMPSYGYHYTLIERILHDKPIITWNGGENVQTVMRVEDFASGMVGLWGNEKAFNEDFGICGEPVTWSEILNTIEDCVGKQVLRVDVPVSTIIHYFPSRKGEFIVDRATDHYVSNEKLKRAVPTFKLQYPLCKGVAETIRYYQEHNFIKGFDMEYDGQCDCLLNAVGINNAKFINYQKSSLLFNWMNYNKGMHPGNKFWEILTRIYMLPQRVLKKLAR